MAAKKSAKKPKSGGRKSPKVRNLPAKSLGASDVRAVKGGDGTYAKVELEYKPQNPDGSSIVGPIVSKVRS
jgi:hypothetical protein